MSRVARVAFIGVIASVVVVPLLCVLLTLHGCGAATSLGSILSTPEAWDDPDRPGVVCYTRDGQGGNVALSCVVYAGQD